MLRSTYSLLLIVNLIVIGRIESQAVMITEVNQAGQWVELYNLSSSQTIDVSNWILWDYPFYSTIADNPFVTIISGNPVMPPNSFLVLEWISINPNDGEIALFSSDDFEDSANMHDYMQYNRGRHLGAEMAVKQGIWDDVDSFVPNAENLGQSLIINDAFASDPTETDSNDWIESDPSQGLSNFEIFNPCSTLLVLDNVFLQASSYKAINIVVNGTIEDIETATTLIAQEAIVFMEDFQVENGAVLIAMIESCQ